MPRIWAVISCVPLLCQLFTQVWAGRDSFRPPDHISLEGNITLGGIFSVRTELNITSGLCQRYDPAGLLRVEAMIYAIDLINRNGGVFDKFTIGYNIFDDCNSINTALESAMTLMMGSSLQERTSWLSAYESSASRYQQSEAFVRMSVNNSNSVHPWGPSPVIGIVGAGVSDISTAVASILSINMIPLVSYGSVSQELSNKDSYPSFMRTVPSDEIQVKAIADLLRHFNWTWVSVIATDDSHGRKTLQGLQEAFDSLDGEICIAQEQLIDVDLDRGSVETALGHIMNDSNANVIVLICSSPLVAQFFKIAQEMNVTGKTFIASGWGNANLPADLEPILSGSVGLIPDNLIECEFLLHLIRLLTQPLTTIRLQRPWLYAYIQESLDVTNTTNSSDLIGIFGLKLDFQPQDRLNCSRLISGEFNPTWFTQAAPVIDAISAIAIALIKMHLNKEVLLPLRLLEYLYQTTYNSSDKTLAFDENGDIDNGYQITIPQKFLGRLRFISVGKWTNHSLQLITERIQSNWPNGSVPISTCRLKCSPGTYKIFSSVSCCWNCIECPEGTFAENEGQSKCFPCPSNRTINGAKTSCNEFKAIQLAWTDSQTIVTLSFCGFGLLLTVITTAILIWHRATPVVRCANAPLLFIMLMLIGFAFTLPVTYIMTPSVAICSIENVEFGVIYSTVIGIFLVKTWHVHRIFTAALHKILAMTSRPTVRQEIWISFIFPTLFSLIAIPYLLTNMPSPDFALGNCGDNWDRLQIISMGYIIILSFASAFVAYRARKLPQNYNESRHICAIMLILVLIWLTSLPSYYSVSSDSRVTILSVTDLAAAYAILVFMFGPKLRIIFFYKAKNTNAYVRRQQWLYTLTQGSWRTLTPKNSSEVSQRRSETSETSFGHSDLCLMAKRPQLSDIVGGETSLGDTTGPVLTGFRRRAATWEKQKELL